MTHGLLIANRQKSILVSIVAHCLDILKINGSAREQLLADAGVDASTLTVADGWFPVSAAERMLHAYLARSSMPVPMLMASRGAVSHAFGVLGYLAHACSNLNAVIVMAQQYERLASDIGFTALRHEPGRVFWCWDCRADDAVFIRHATEFVLALNASIADLIMGRDAPALLAVHFRHAAPDNEAVAALYEEWFRCPVVFAQAESALIFSPETMTSPLRGFNPDLRETLNQHASKLLTRLETTASFLQVAREQLLILVREGCASRDTLALKFGMSGRTLLRRLDDEGTNYHDLLDAVRLELAREYLRESPQTVVEISQCLNFRESHTFIRWFKRVSGTTPGEFRRNDPAVKG
jgi:AraC-like DNA-binding protein